MGFLASPAGRVCVLYPASALALVLSAGQAWADETVTARGKVSCHDGSTGQTLPMAGVRVELVDSDCDGSELCDDTMGVGYADKDGNFAVTGSGGDPFGGKPDVYVRFVFNDGHGVRLTDEVDGDRTASTPEHDHDNVGSGEINFGPWVLGASSGAGESSQCAVWMAAKREYDSYVKVFGSPPPAGHLDVLYWSAVWSGTPWTNTDTIHWPIDYPSYALTHEFGHSIRHAADGSGAHFTNDVTRFRYARTHSMCDPDGNFQAGESDESQKGYGFNEGWAEYWEGQVSGCPASVPADTEGQVARQLFLLQTGNNLSRQDMVGVLIANPGSIHSLAEFTAALSTRVSVKQSMLTQAAARAGQTTKPPSPAKMAQVRVDADNTRRVASTVTALQLQAKALRAAPAPLSPQVRAAAVLVAPQPPQPPVRPRPGRGKDLIPPTSQTPPPAPATAACQQEECAQLFNAITAVAIRQGQASMLDTYAATLSSSTSRAFADKAAQAVAAGRFEEWRGGFRNDLRSKSVASLDQGFAAAEQALSAQREKFGAAYDAYAAELAKARQRLAAMDKGGATGLLPDAVMPADKPVRQ